jgi:hypothetical protein
MGKRTGEWDTYEMPSPATIKKSQEKQRSSWRRYWQGIENATG